MQAALEGLKDSSAERPGEQRTQLETERESRPLGCKGRCSRAGVCDGDRGLQSRKTAPRSRKNRSSPSSPACRGKEDGSPLQFLFSSFPQYFHFAWSLWHMLCTLSNNLFAPSFTLQFFHIFERFLFPVDIWSRVRSYFARISHL